MELRFGKFKGSTVEELAKTKDGRAYLGWLVEQPTEGQFKKQNDDRNAYIRLALSEKPAPTKNPNVTSVTPQEKMEVQSNEKIVMAQLDEVIRLLEELIAVAKGSRVEPDED